MTARDRDGALAARVHVSSESRFVDGSAIRRPTRPTPQYGSIATYTMFRDRVNYMLGRSKHWPTCDGVNRKFANEPNAYVGRTNPLCGVTLENRDPPELHKVPPAAPVS